jgi:hypothetical protein
MRPLNSFAGFRQTTLLDFATVGAPIGLFLWGVAKSPFADGMTFLRRTPLGLFRDGWQAEGALHCDLRVIFVVFARTNVPAFPRSQ